MRGQSPVGPRLSAVALVSLFAACDNPVDRLPTSPGLPSVTAVEMTGPSTIAPGQSAQFTVRLRLSDGTSKVASTDTKVVWNSSNPSVLAVDNSGLATAGAEMGDTTVSARVPTATGTRTVNREVVILPNGTYRLVGFVGDADLTTSPVAGARIEVTPGPLVATTGLNGRYAVYGVPADANVQVSAHGYATQETSLRLSGHRSLNFHLTLSGSRLSLAGAYALSIDMVGPCLLPADVQHRRYDAVLTQTGAMVDVALHGTRFLVHSNGKGNRFSGYAGPTGATFTLDPFLTSYYHFIYPSVAEQLPDGRVLVPDGTVVTTGSAAGLSGQFNGRLSTWDARFPDVALLLGECSSSTVMFTLTQK